MKNRQLYRFMLLAALPALLFTSCRFEEDDYFDESASLRVEHTNEAVKDILVNAPQGWVMQYFANTGDEGFEGFNLFAKFDANGKVTLSSNHRMLRNDNAGKYTESTSVYQMLLEDGPVLAFNTWNDVLTVFVDPVDPSAAPKSLVKDGAGMAGDHNFVIVSYSDDEVILRGERHGAEVRLKKIDVTPQEYIAATDEMKNYITNTSITNYYLTDGTDTLYMLNPRSGHFRIGERISDPLRAHWVACCYTPNGFRLERQDTIGTAKFQELKLSDDKTCLQNEDGTAKVIPCWDSYVVEHTAVWPLDATAFSTEQSSLFEQINVALKSYNTVLSLGKVGIGKSSGTGAVTGIVFTIYTNAAKTRTNTVGLAMKMSRTAFGKMQIVSSPEDKMDNQMAAVLKNIPSMENLVRAFAATFTGNYDIVPDDYFLPTVVQLNPTDGGTPFTLNVK